MSTDQSPPTQPHPPQEPSAASPAPSVEAMKELPPYFFVIDVESVGLHGEPFAVGWSVHSRAGGHYEESFLACPMEQAAGSPDDRMWCAKNIPPIPVTNSTPRGVRDAFWPVWMAWKAQGAVMAADCGWPVEARFLALCIEDDRSRNWEGPYPMHDVASVRLAVGLDPLATLPRQMEELPAHHPMKDARQSGRLLCEALKIHAQLRQQLATSQQAQRDTAARAGMAEELAGMLTEYREALYDGPENLTGLTNDRLETESAALLARYAALPKGRL